MPPKPPLRTPIKPPIAPKRKSTPSILARPAQAAPRATPKPPTPPSSSQTATPPPPPPPPPSHWSTSPDARNSTSRYLKWGSNGLVAICIMLWIRDHQLEFQHVRGSSMAPTLSPDAHETGREDYVLVRPYLERAARRKNMQQEDEKDGNDGNKWGIHRGDVVTFWKPHKPSEMGIKRIVALEGDVVFPARGYALDAEARVRRIPGLPDGLPDDDPDAVFSAESDDAGLGRVVVPHGHVWIEGDNWRKSLDSNDFGPISKGLVIGKAVWVWRDWFGVREVGDARSAMEVDMRSRVVKGRSGIPAVFLE